MDEYLSDITKDMILCLLRAGSIKIRCKIWGKMFIRDGFSYKVIKKPSKKNKNTTVKIEVNVDTKATVSTHSVQFDNKESSDLDETLFSIK